MGINKVQLHQREPQGNSPKKTMIHQCLANKYSKAFNVHMSVFINTVFMNSRLTSQKLTI